MTLLHTLVTALGVMFFVPQHPQDSTDIKELTRLEAVWNEAHVRGDAAILDSLWADDLTVMVPGMQVITKEIALRILRSGRMNFSRYETSEIKIRTYGDAAVVTGIVERERKMNETNLVEKWRFTKTYIRRAGRWFVVAWHASSLE